MKKGGKGLFLRTMNLGCGCLLIIIIVMILCGVAGTYYQSEEKKRALQAEAATAAASGEHRLVEQQQREEAKKAEDAARKRNEALSPRSSPIAAQLPLQKTSLPSFTLLKDDSYEDAGTAKVIWSILVHSSITRESLVTLLNDLYSQAQSKKFKQHAAATVTDIKAYMSKQHAESGMGQWIGWMSKSGGQYQPRLSLDDRQINQVGKKAELRFGLPEEQRKQIWQETVRAEDRADDVAEQTYPEPSPRNRDAFMAAFEKREKLRKELLNVYRDEVAKRYGITREQLSKISREAFEKSWALPK